MTSPARNSLFVRVHTWLRSRLANLLDAMLSSVTRILQPKTSTKRKRVHHHVVERTYEKSMDDLLVEIRELFAAPLEETRLADFSTRLQAEYKTSLLASRQSMLPSYQHTLPTGNEHGDFLALDAGGSTFRIALIRLAEKKHDGDGMEVRRVRSFCIDETVRKLSGTELFDWFASRIGEMLAEYNHMSGTTDAHLQMGLAWSFPIEQTSLRTGRLLAMGKGFRAAHELEGKDLGDLIMNACHARGLNVDLRAIVNDSSATLLSQAYRDPSTCMSLILGTGVNAAAFLPTTALGADKFGERPASWHAAAKRVVVNTELSMFGRHVLPTTRWDEDLNAQHLLPDYQPLEYLATGMYLGEIVRLILLEAIPTAGLFDGQIPDHFDTPYALETRILAALESDDTPELRDARAAFLSAHPLRSAPKRRDLEFMRAVARLVSRRAAAYLATALHALWAVRTSAEGVRAEDSSAVTIACDGSMVEKYPGFRQRMQKHLDALCVVSGAKEGAVVLQVVPESSILGAAVAASCND